MHFIVFIISAVLILIGFQVLPVCKMPFDLEFLLSALAITYAIIASFAINRLNEKYNSILNLVSEEDGLYKSLFREINLLGKKKYIEKAKAILNNHYGLIEEHFNNLKIQEFLKYSKVTSMSIFTMISNITKEKLNANELVVYEMILMKMEDLSKNRMALLNKAEVDISKTDWSLLLLLSIQLVVVIFFFRQEHLFFNLILSTVAISVMLILFIINELKKLKVSNKLIGEQSAKEVIELVNNL